MKTFIKISILLLLFASFTANGQPYINEDLYLCIDRNYYVSGEDILFSVFLPKDISKIIYIELYNEYNAFSQASFSIQNRHCYGKITIPEDIASGHYAVRAYTWYQQNYHCDGFATIPVTVLNPQHGIPEVSEDNLISNNESFSTTGIILDKANYSRRDKVFYKIENTRYPDDSIIAANLVITKKGLNNNTFSISKNLIKKNTYFHYPETNGPVLHGKISGEKPDNRTVYLALTGRTTYFRMGVSDSSGIFNIPYDPFFEDQTMFINTNNSEGIDSILLSNNYCGEYTKFQENPPLSEPIWQDLVRNKSINKVYYKEDVAAIGIKHIPLKIPDTPRYSVRTKDYIELSSLKEIFQEIVPYVKIRETRLQQSLAVLDDRRDILYDNPIVFLDNLPINNMEELFNIHPGKVDSISVINRPYAYGSFALDGIIQIYTNTDNLGGYNFMPPSMFFINSALQRNSRPEHADYGNNDRAESPLPNFQTVIFSQPNPDLSERLIEGTFYTCDDIGQYEIIFTYMTKQGLTGKTKASFTVN